MQHDALVGRVEQHLVNALCLGSTVAKDDLQHLPNVVTEEMLTKIEQNQCVTVPAWRDTRPFPQAYPCAHYLTHVLALGLHALVAQ